MKATVRMRLTFGFLGLLSIGSVASVAILAVLSRSIDELKRVVTVSDVIEHKALEMRFDMLAMSDAMRGYLINPANKAEQQRKKQADDDFEADVEDIRKLAPQGEILKLVQEAADMDAKVLNPVEDELLVVDRLRRRREGQDALHRGVPPAAPQKQEAIIADIEKETIRLKQAALQSAESSYARGPRHHLGPRARSDRSSASPSPSSWPAAWRGPSCGWRPPWPAPPRATSPTSWSSTIGRTSSAS